MEERPSWLLLDERPGNRSQCLGVAAAMGIAFQEKELEYTGLAALPNAILGASFLGLDGKGRLGLTEPWPGLVIAAGRRTAPVARRIKRLSGGAAFLVQIMDPGAAGRSEFDLVCVPGHDDPVPGDNILRITGAPHGVTAETLTEATKVWAGELGMLPHPRIALMVGGSTRRRTFTEAMARELGAKASAMAEDVGGSLLVTTSRRTAGQVDALFSEICVPHHAFRWGDAGVNPYPGYLALGDAIVVTGDSVSMVSEACAREVPVFIYAPDALITPKHARFHQELYEKGYAQPLTGDFNAQPHPPLNAALQIAEEIKKRLGL